MERSVESSFGQSGQMREKHLKNLAESGAGADVGRAAGLSLEGQRETGANVGSDALHVETNYNKQATGTLKYDTGSSNDIQATIERTKAKQAAAKLEAAKEGKVDEWEMVGGDEEAPMVIDRAAVEKSAAEDQLEKAKRRAQLAAEDETRKSA